MSAYQNFLTFFILLALAIILYCRVTGKTLTDFFREIKDAVFGKVEDVKK